VNNQKRWALLEHVSSPDDSFGRHFDLLLEDKNGCRSWRLAENLVLDGTSQEAVPTPLHRLEWLSVKEGPVSEGRGWARRVMGGFFYGELPTDEKEAIQIKLSFNQLMGTLEIKNCMCRFRSL